MLPRLIPAKTIPKSLPAIPRLIPAKTIPKSLLGRNGASNLREGHPKRNQQRPKSLQTIQIVLDTELPPQVGGASQARLVKQVSRGFIRASVATQTEVLLENADASSVCKKTQEGRPKGISAAFNTFHVHTGSVHIISTTLIATTAQECLRCDTRSETELLKIHVRIRPRPFS
jgi:hypothetical protein